MNDDLAAPMSRLVDELKRLPGIGPKSAQRIAFHLLGVSLEEAEKLAGAISAMRGSIQLCERCNNIAEGALCPICSDPKRDHTIICVLEQPNNIMIVERTRQYQGLYHVLHGAISPLRNARNKPDEKTGSKNATASPVSRLPTVEPGKKPVVCFGGSGGAVRSNGAM